MDGSSGKNTRGLELGLSPACSLDRALAVDGVTQSVDNSAEKTGTNGNIDNLTSSLDSVTLLDQPVVTEDSNTDVVGFQVQAHASDTGRELNHFLGLDVSETVDTGDTVTNGKDTTSLLDVTTGRSASDSALEDGRNLGSSCSVKNGINRPKDDVEVSRVSNDRMA